MRILSLVFLGSGLGGVLRFALGRWVQAFVPVAFPLGTATVNVLACLVLGAAVGFAEARYPASAALRYFLVVGFCGGFSTFSAFSHESLVLLRSGDWPAHLVYVLGSLVLCWLAVAAGMAWAQR